MTAHSVHKVALLFIIFFVNTYIIYADGNSKYEHYFLLLDEEISRHSEYEARLDLQIKDLILQRSKVCDPEELYLINKLLYSKYETYICDSALRYLDENEKIALEVKNYEWLNETYLIRSNIYIQTGMLNAAVVEFDKIKFDYLSDPNKARYYSLKIYLLMQEKEVSGVSDLQKVQEYGMELAKYAVIGDESYIWALLWSYNKDDKNEKLIEYLEDEYEKNSNLNNPRAGNNALVLSRVYGAINEEDQRIKYLCLAASIGIKHVNRDPSALLETVSYLSQIGDSKRAYVYMEYVLKGQSFYPARVSSSQMAQYMKIIFEETQKINEDKQNKTSQFLFWLSVVIILLVIFLIIIAFSIRKMYFQKKSISDINIRLNNNICELSNAQSELIVSNQKINEAAEQILETNKKLKEANYIKEEYIGYLFSTCSNYINKLDEFRQSINRLIKVGKVDDVLRKTQPTNTYMNSEIKELNQTFDSTFLSIYPNFVNDLNSLLREEERYVIHSNDGLNTELRIFALVWLGIDSSSKIANLLHVSPQTIYNARMKMKNKAIADSDKFTELVYTLGRERV